MSRACSESISTPELFTIKDIAEVTGLEESLLRFYESEYQEEFPAKIRKGGLLFFDPAAVNSFQRVHQRHSRMDSHGPEAGKDQARRYGRVIAVTSGKGGVGKTNLALNLAIELQRLDTMSVVLDADMGMANVHLLAGVNPEKDLMDLIKSDARLSEIIVDGPEGIGIIPGGGGVVSLADSSRLQREKIILSLQEIERAADVVIIDTGAGMSANVRDFLATADEILFMLTPDLTSLTDAYGLLKTLNNEHQLAGRPLYSVVNMVDTLQQARDTALRFADCARKFLGLEIKNMGYLLKDSIVAAATVRRTPYTVFRPEARISRNTANLAAALLSNDTGDAAMSSAFGRYLKRLRQAERNLNRNTDDFRLTEEEWNNR